MVLKTQDYELAAVALKKELHKNAKTPPSKPNSFALVEDIVKRQATSFGRLSGADEQQKNLVTEGPHKRHSTLAIEELRRIELSHMSLRTVHEGRYLILRVVSKVYQVGGALFVAQSPNGRAVEVELEIPPYSTVSSVEETRAMLPVGRCFIIKEPYFVSEGGSLIIKVSSPTDIVFANADSLKGLEWKKPAAGVGNFTPPTTVAECIRISQAYRAKDWLAAAEDVLNEGLKKEKDHVGMLDERSAVRLLMKRWRSTLRDADHILLRGPLLAEHERFRAHYLAAKAYYGLQLWGPAQTRLREATATIDSEDQSLRKPIEIMIDRIDQRSREAKFGNEVYDWEALYDLAQESPDVDLADYTATSDMRVATVKGKGRGLLANREIEPSCLLMVARPLASAHIDEIGVGKHTMAANLHVGGISNPTAANLPHRLAMRTLDDTAVASLVGLLFAGSKYGPAPPAFSLQKLKPKAEADGQPVDIDMGRIEGVVAHNAFIVRQIGPVFAADLDDDKAGLSGVNSRAPVAIYGAPSLFNHSCNPNVVISFVGDALVARATRFMDTNDELTIPYVDPSLDYEARKEALKKRGIDKCICAVCEEDSKDSLQARNRRRHLLRLVTNLSPACSVSENMAVWERHYDTVVARVTDLVKTYSTDHDREMRAEMYQAYMCLANMAGDLARAVCSCSHHNLHRSSSFRERAVWANLAIENALKAINSVGGDNPEYQDTGTDTLFACHSKVVVAYLLAAGISYFIDDYDEGACWFAAGFKVDRVCNGLGVKVFAKRYAKELDRYCLDLADLPDY